jgi:two-component system NarL family sensor kinase
MIAWTDMLSTIGQKNSPLYKYLIQESGSRGLLREAKKRNVGRTIVRELERERSRIARELHAGAGQPLAGIKLNLEMLDQCAGALPAAGREALARLQTLAEQALEQVRAVSHGLHPPGWQELTTEQAIRSLVRSSGLSIRITVEADIRELPVEPSHTVKIALYRCAQECISNVARHSCATHFKLTLAPAGDFVELAMEDNGHGFLDAAPERKGIGLQAVREHSEALGGTCEVAGGPEGVRIRVRLPLTVD